MELSKDFKVSSKPVTPDGALKFAAELELAIGEIMAGKRKPANIPMEPMVALIQFARDNASGGNDELVKAMVNRFLGWKLPDDFGPDCHISFNREAADAPYGSWPVGTNLLTADQAKAMFMHCMGLEGGAA